MAECSWRLKKMEQRYDAVLAVAPIYLRDLPWDDPLECRIEGT